uniref:Uncharacterized protein n=1 Tax=Nothoprocta perdicaria TaxID=30464 RepID=A0A8C6Z4S4_NOTPE
MDGTSGRDTLGGRSRRAVPPGAGAGGHGAQVRAAPGRAGQGGAARLPPTRRPHLLAGGHGGAGWRERRAVRAAQSRGRAERGARAVPAAVAPLTPLSPRSAAPAAWPGSATAAQGLLEGRRCRYLCTGRACCQALEALLALLILVCGCVSLGPPGGYTGLADLGGLYYYQFGGAYSGLTGADGERARRLDQQLGALKAPLARAVVAGGAALAAAAALKLLAGALRLPWRLPAWLLLEGGLDVAVAAALPPAMYCCFRELLGVYGSPVCTEREQLYGSKGYQGFRCGLHGAEVAAGVAGSLAVVAHLVSATLALRAYCAVRRLKRKPVTFGTMDMLQFLFIMLWAQVSQKKGNI